MYSNKNFTTCFTSKFDSFIVVQQDLPENKENKS